MDRLRALEAAYRSLPFALTYWRDYQGTIPLDRFRANQYLGNDTTRVSYDYARAVAGDLLDRLDEDRAFGADPPTIDGRLVSRDLVDSALEIAFLRRGIGPELERARILDVGAGYGRSAYRLTTLYPECRVWCTDGVPVSTRVCELYLAHRKVTHAEVVPAHELARIPEVDVAINVHSWSECSYEAITFWLDLIAARGARWLFLVPHRGANGALPQDGFLWSCESSGDGQNFWPAILARGYRLSRAEPKYPPGVHGFEPTTYYLFGRV